MTDNKITRCAIKVLDLIRDISPQLVTVTQARAEAWADIFADVAPWIADGDIAALAVRAHFGETTRAPGPADIIRHARAIHAERHANLPRYRCATCQDTGTVCNDDGVPVRGRPRCHHNGTWTVTTAWTRPAC